MHRFEVEFGRVEKRLRIGRRSLELGSILSIMRFTCGKVGYRLFHGQEGLFRYQQRRSLGPDGLP